MSEPCDQSQEPTLVMLSGMGADATVFAAQRIAFPDLIVPPWLLPERRESLDGYALRVAEWIRSETGVNDKPLVLGGASFGGILALHVAKHLKPSAIVLVGSVPNPRHLPWHFKVMRPLSVFTFIMPVSIIQWIAMVSSFGFFGRRNRYLKAVVKQFSQSEPAVLRWSARQILLWKHAPAIECPFFHIHGRKDRVLPIRATEPTHTVDGGGHVISMTHPREVTQLLREVCGEITSGGSPTSLP